jgi:tetratricopeptide (TPR) repeat protein
MVSCKQCTTLNSLDSAFCKKCGATLDANEIVLASEKLAAMIADGNRLFADGRTEDALMVAETSIASNPSSAAAVSLKGMCLERKGQIAEALECFERVVELQPDSTLDRLKVNDLKNLMIAEKFAAGKEPNRRVALIGAMAATVLVVAGGAIFARATSTSTEVKAEPKLLAMNDPGRVRTFDEIMPKEGTAPKQNQPAPPSNPDANTLQQNATNNPMDGTGPVRPSGRERVNLDRYNGGSLPSPDGGIQGQIGPVRVQLPEGGLPNPSQRTTQVAPPTPNRDPDPDPVPPNTTVQANTDPPPVNDPGIIEIEVSKGSPKNGGSGGGEVAPTGNGRQALIATARSQMMSGNYSAAANTYERALRAGADPGSTNQRLGQCYAQMGRNGDAVAAYTRAANAFEKSGNTQGAEACRQAVKVLGG